MTLSLHSFAKINFDGSNVINSPFCAINRCQNFNGSFSACKIHPIALGSTGLVDQRDFKPKQNISSTINFLKERVKFDPGW